MVTQEEKREIERFFGRCVTQDYCDAFVKNVDQTLEGYREEHCFYKEQFDN